MGGQPTQHESFIVRIWHEEDQPGWRAWIQHTRSGESTVVRSVQELVAFFELRTGRLDDTQRQGLK
jgi:hypothetical protein